MPSPFDILGALSFTQGVLTLIVVSVTAVFTATQQARSVVKSNTEQCQKLAVNFSSSLVRAQNNARNTSTEHANNISVDWESRANYLMSRLQRLANVPYLRRWLKREDHAKELVELAELNTRLTVEMDLMLLEWRLLEGFENSQKRYAESLRETLNQLVHNK